MTKKYLLLITALAIIIAACNQESKSKEEACEVETVKDPNNPKPMALMMRTMANNCDSMRLKIAAGQTVDSAQYPLPIFWKAEPTDSSVLEELFFNNAKDLEQAYHRLMSNKSDQLENYNVLISKCVQCHTSYCSGPLKRIRKLPIDYVKQ
jgi:hypothetical protein